MAHKGYQGYRGRSSWPKILLVILLLLILILACAFLFLQRYLVYTDDGGIRFDLPFFSGLTDGPASGEDEAASNTQADPGLELYIEEDTGTPAPDIHSSARRDLTERRLVELNRLPADAQTLRETLQAAGANGFVYTVKDESGRVFYNSEVAVRDALIAGGASREALEELCADENYIAVARINCFHDSFYAFSHMEAAGICQSSGYIWYDNRSSFWLDPDKEAARDYVISFALECAQMGFDELLLEEMCYPVSGKLEKIDYSGNTLDKSEALGLFLDELREALASYDVEISLLLSDELLVSGSSEVSGQELTKLLPAVDAVYIPTENPDEARSMLAMYAGEDSLEFVPVLQEPAAEENWYVSG